MGTILDLTRLTSFTGSAPGNTGNGSVLSVNAQAGGKVALGNVTTYTGGSTNFHADGTNSTIVLNGLQRIFSDAYYNSTLQATNGGTVTLNSGTVSLSRVDVQAASTGTISAGTIQMSGGTLSGNSTIQANIVNSGATSPGVNNAGTLSIAGSFTQTSTGSLNISIGGTTAGTQYDQVVATGPVTLGGALNLSTFNGFSAANNNSFVVVTGSSVSGLFASITGLSAGNGLYFSPIYNPTNLTLLASNTLLVTGQVPSVYANTAIKTITLSFSEALNTTDANNAANYTLVDYGVNGTGQGTTIAVTPAYTANSTQVTLTVPALADGSYQITLASTIHAANGTLIDGAGNGVTGTAYVGKFVVETATPTVLTPGQQGTVTVFNTGVNANGNALAGGSLDPHFSVISGPAPLSYPVPAVVYTSSNPNNISSSWVPDSSTSAWIGFNNTSNDSVNGKSYFGTYTYRMTFTLGSSLTTAVLSGFWAADQNGSIALNGQTTGAGWSGTTLADGNWNSSSFPNLNAFTIASGFKSGLNTLDFIVNEPDGFDGLRVAGLTLTTTVNPSPPITPTQIQVPYSDPVGMDLASVINPANYQLLSSGGDGVLGNGNDLNVSSNIGSVSYNSTTQIATLNLIQPLPDEVYQLTVNGQTGIVNVAGNKLLAGKNFVEVLPLATLTPTVGVLLDSGSDSGTSHSDNLTNVTNPTFDVTVNKAGSLELDVNGSAVSTQAVTAGTIPITLTTALGNGGHAIKAIFTPLTGSVVNASVTITIDTTHPSVVAGASTAQAPLASRVLTFSKAIDPSTINTSVVTVMGPGGVTVPVSTITGTGAIYTLNFTSPLMTPGSYTVNVGAGVLDLAGNAISAPTSDSFNLQSLAATVSLVLDTASDSGASHSDGLTNVTKPTFDVTVNQAGSIALEVNGSTVQTQSAGAAGTVMFTLTSALSNGPHSIEAVFTPTVGTAVNKTISITIDTTHPSVVAGASTAQAPSFSRTLTFSKVIDPNTINTSDVTLIGPSGTAVPIASITGSGTTYTLNFNPLPIYLPGTYTVNVGAGVADLAGNAIAAPTSDSFTLLPDVTGPYVVSFQPSKPTNQNVSSFTVTFDEPILVSSFTTSQVSITGPNGPVNLSGATITPLDPAQETFQVSFPTQSTEGVYSVSIGPDITDLSGNAMSIIQVTNEQFLTKPASWTFNGSSTYLAPGSVSWTPNGAIRLTDINGYETGSSFFGTPQPADPFVVSFDFNIHNGGGAGGGADGFTFVAAQDPNQGTTGGGIGYQGYPGTSFAVEFDTYNNGGEDPDNTHVGIDYNGVLEPITATVSPALGSGTTFHAIIRFDGKSLLSVVVESASGPTTTLSYNLPANAIPSQYTFGFTGSTGGGYEDADISNVALYLLPNGGTGGAYTTTFTIDKTPPTVNAPTISSTQLTAHFADNLAGLDPTTVTNKANYALAAIVGGNPVDESSDIASVSFNTSTGVATLNLTNPLTDGTYQLTVHGSGIADLAGNHLLNGADFTQTLVLSSVPASVGVILDSGSDSGASHTDDLTNVTKPTFDVTVNKSGSLELDVDGSAVSTQAVTAGTIPITLTSALGNGAHTIKAIFTPTVGSAVSASLSITIDTTHPSVVAGTATAQAPLFTRVLTFSKAIDPSTINTSDVTVIGPGGVAVPLSTVTGSGTTYTLTFASPLVGSGSYTVNVGAGVLDLAGNAIASPTSDAFTLLPDLTPPAVVAFSPLGSLSSNVSTITVGFNKAINPASFAPSVVTIVTPSGTLPTAQISISEVDASDFQILIPAQSAQGAYTVTIGSGITDLSGNHLSSAAGYSGSFTIDKTPPQVVSISPSGNIGAVVSSVNITFSKPINLFDPDLQRRHSGRPRRLGHARRRVAGLGRHVQRPVLAPVGGRDLHPDRRRAGRRLRGERPVLDVHGLVHDPARRPVRPAPSRPRIRPSARCCRSPTRCRTSATSRRPAPGLTRFISRPRPRSTPAPSCSGASATPRPWAWAGSSTAAPRCPCRSIRASRPGPITCSSSPTASINSSRPAGPTTRRARRSTSPTARFPDLVPSGVSGPATASAGQSVPVTWTDTNSGNATAVGPWTDEVFLSYDGTVTNAVLLTSITTSSLAAHSSISQSAMVTIPTSGPASSGTLQFVIVVNPSQTPFESNATNNTAFASATTQVPPALTLSLPSGVSSIAENASNPTINAYVTRNGPMTGPLVVTLTSADTTKFTVPSTVTIPAGQAYVTVPITVHDDGVVEGNVQVAITASATNFASSQQLVTDINTDQAALAVTIPNPSTPIPKGSTIVATVTRSGPTDQPLTVSLSTNNPDRVSVLPTVTIPAGQASATFALGAIDDDLIEGTQMYAVTASATALGSSTLNFSISDSDVPNLSVALARTTVSEADGAMATTGTVTVSFISDKPIVVALSVPVGAPVVVPATVTIPANASSATFPIGAIDDHMVDGTHTAVITASVTTTGTNVPLSQGSATASISVTDADGPALKVILASPDVVEGLTPATTGTVVRTGGTTGALVVTLTSSDTTEATVPTTVTIPDGQTSATFAINTPADNLTRGTVTATITATANGPAPGNASLIISDQYLPDLVVSSVSAPSTVYNNQTYNVSFTVTNQGTAYAVGPWEDELFLSTAPTGGTLTPLGTFTLNASIPPGEFITRSLPFFAPTATASYYVVAQTDVNAAIIEASTTNNTTVATQPLQVLPAYTATVKAGVSVVLAGTPISLSGSATDAATGQPEPFQLVNVHIFVKGTERIISALTDANGNFATTFQPLPGEAGQYTIGATNPGVTQATVQSSFTIVGISAAPPQTTLSVIPGTAAVGGQVTLTNLSNIAVTNLSASVVGAPSNLNVVVTLGDGSAGQGIAGSGTLNLTYQVTATDTSTMSGTFTIHVVTAEGAKVDIPVPFSVMTLTPHLVATPGTLQAGMIPSNQTIVEFTVQNQGGAPRARSRSSCRPARRSSRSPRRRTSPRWRPATRRRSRSS